jgi:putative hemolysin
MGRAYARAVAQSPATDFSSRVLAVLDVHTDADVNELNHIPPAGPLIVVANHPFGVLDGLLLLSLTGRMRSDVKLLGNDLLQHIPELRPNLVPVDVFGGPGAVQRNAAALRHAIQWLRRGGCVAMFPAGEVAHTSGAGGRIVDSDWRSTATELAVRTGAAVVPVFFEGRNSRLFRAAGRVHPLLRTVLLPREMWAKRGSTIVVRIGKPVMTSSLAALSDVAQRTAHVRARVESLAGGAPASASRAPMRPHAAIAPRGRAGRIEANIETLQTSVLFESGAYQVFCASARDLPDLLPEIGRLREVAFRNAGEGTGLARDLDRFDETYEHLFVWDRVRNEVAGAYRLGATDVVAARGRVDGLYTRTLFEYEAPLLDQIGPALELGRSFVQPVYQRDFSPLMLLWKGISRVVAQRPRYRRLFGVVSISDLYDSTSRQLLVKFLQTRQFDEDLGRLVRAKNPPPPPRTGLVESTTVATLAEVSALIRRIEPDGKDIPVLLRQYLKLNAKLIGFTVDSSFGNVLDGLVVVDLADVEPAILARYMGRTEVRAFLEKTRAR